MSLKAEHQASSHTPIRTCVGCRSTAPQQELVRYVLRDGVPVADPERRLPGRGAYLHDSGECLARASKRGGFARSFKGRVSGS